MAHTYDAHSIETKWQQRWEASQLYRCDLDQPQRPFYNLMEFPYPSGEGLHVGHVYTYCGADTLGRLRRMQGYTVFQPMGFDAFGIHSENYALKLGQHPAELVPANIRRFRSEQLQRLGCQFDWSREVDTTDPAYYRWTQWIFVQLFKAGLAYQAEAPVNWCPSCKTVLANEQVIDGLCERCDTPMTTRVMRQWFLRITQYAEQLLDFSAVDFPETVIKRQRAWIGRSEGAELQFAIRGEQGEAASPTLTVFSTRPETIFGATFIALAPEHPQVMAITSAEQQAAVAEYIAAAARKLERERLIGAAQSGVFTGAYAINPANGAAIPIWVADYVLARYGSGAIMGVPAHDQRDYSFAQAHGLPVVTVLRPTSVQAATEAAAVYEGTGELINSGEFSGITSAAARPAIIAWLEQTGKGRVRVMYRLRDWLISRQRYWGPPIPIIYCADCGTLPVPEEQLPVLLPPTANFRPSGSGEAPLAAIAEFVHTSCPQCGGPARRETEVSDNFLDSAWYFLRYTSTEYQDRPWDVGRLQNWLPVDQYAGGPEHTTMHHLYARFITHALHDLGHVPVAEPFKRLRLHGTITHAGAKMSKSRGNVISPDGYMARYGADILRMYMLFLGPWEEGGDFSDQGISGIARFVARIWELFSGERANTESAAAVPGDEIERRRRQLVARVTASIDGLRFHVAIAALMEEANWLREHAVQPQAAAWQEMARSFVLLLAPLAPHLAEELWERLGQPFSVHQQPWPQVEPELAVALIELPVQVNGKLRDRISVPAAADDSSVTQMALASERVQASLNGATPRRVVVVPGRVVNIVV